MLQVPVEDRVEVVLDRGGARDVDLRDARGMPERCPHLVRVALGIGEIERRVDVAVDDGQAAGRVSDVEVGRRSARHRGSCPLDRRGEGRLGCHWFAAACGESAKTIVNAPSERSPKCCCSTSRTCSDCVPGTENVFERIAESFALASPPRMSAAIQSARTQRRCRITNFVQRAIVRIDPRRRGSGYGYGMAPRDKPSPESIQAEIEELFSELWQVPRFAGLRRGFRPNVDSYHTDDPHELTVIVEVPGIDPEFAHDRRQRADAPGRGRAVAGASRRPRLPADGDRIRPVLRQVRLAEDVDPDGATARYAHGIVTISLPVVDKPLPEPARRGTRSSMVHR